MKDRISYVPVRSVYLESAGLSDLFKVEEGEGRRNQQQTSNKKPQGHHPAEKCKLYKK